MRRRSGHAAAHRDEALRQGRTDGRRHRRYRITNQRETTVVVDRETGQPVHHRHCVAGSPYGRSVRPAEGPRAGAVDQRKTGLVVDAYFSGTKLEWLLRSVPGARAKAKAGKLAFGTVDSWLVWNLTGGRVHVTDPSNASRTMLFNLRTGDWTTSC